MTKEMQGVDLILSQAMKMNMHAKPSYYEVDQHSLGDCKLTTPQ